MKEKKIAIVYDWFDSWGGVERVLLTLHEMFPYAIFYTSYFDEKKARWAKDLDVRTSFIQNLPPFIKNNRARSVTFYPFAFESLDFCEFDIVISVTSSFAKSVITHPDTLHICYLLTPTRFLWTSSQDYSTSFLTNPIISHLKKWDLVASQRPDRYISISKTVQKRLKEIYKKDSEVIYPPFDVDYWSNCHPKQIEGSLPAGRQVVHTNEILKQLQHDPNFNFFLVVSRLEPYKKVDLAIQAFNQLKKENLIIVGRGTQSNVLRRGAGNNISFIHEITDHELAYLYSRANALLMPQEEDFGYVALEAQSFGCPIIAYNKGGAVETVIENKTGLLFDEQSVPSIQNALAKFSQISYTLKESTGRFGRENIEKFSKEVFVEKFLHTFTK